MHYVSVLCTYRSCVNEWGMSIVKIMCCLHCVRCYGSILSELELGHVPHEYLLFSLCYIFGIIKNGTSFSGLSTEVQIKCATFCRMLVNIWQWIISFVIWVKDEKFWIKIPKFVTSGMIYYEFAKHLSLF